MSPPRDEGRLPRRALLALPLLAACGGLPPKPAAPSAAPMPLHLEPLADLVKAPSLVWMLELSPKVAFADDTLLAGVHRVVSDERFRRFAAENGGVDPRSLAELVIARYPDATLTLGRGTIDPAALERAFTRRATRIDGRAIDVASPPVVRLFGDGAKERVQMCTFGREAFALEEGRFGPLRVAAAYAEGKLKKAKPALRAEPLARAVGLLGEGSVARFFASGPFEGEWSAALGGLLRAATGVAVGARTTRHPAAKGGLVVTAVVLGEYGHAQEDAARRLGATLDVLLAKNPFGRMLGLHEPLEAPRVDPVPGGLSVVATFDTDRAAKGLHAVLDAEIDEIVGSLR